MRELLVSVAASLIVSIAIAVTGFIVTSAVQAQKITVLESRDSDKEIRLRGIEFRVERRDQNVAWIKSALSEKGKHP